MQTSSHCSPHNSFVTNLHSSTCRSPRTPPPDEHLHLDAGMVQQYGVINERTNRHLFLTDVDSPLRVCRYCNCAILDSVISTHEPLCAMMIEMKRSREEQANVHLKSRGHGISDKPTLDSAFYTSSEAGKGLACVESRELRESELKSEEIGRCSPASSSSCTTSSGLPPSIDVPTRRPSPEMETTRSSRRSSPTRSCTSSPSKWAQKVEKKESFSATNHDGTMNKESSQQGVHNQRVEAIISGRGAMDGESIRKDPIPLSPLTSAFAHSAGFLINNKNNPIVAGEGRLAAREEEEKEQELGGHQKSNGKDSEDRTAHSRGVARSLSIGGDEKGKRAGERHSNYQALVTVRVEERSSESERKVNDDETESEDDEEREQDVFITAFTAGGNSTQCMSRPQICDSDDKRSKLSARDDCDGCHVPQPSSTHALISIEFPDDSGVGGNSASLARFVSQVVVRELAARRWENKARSVAESEGTPRGGTNSTLKEEKSADRCGESAYDDPDEESVPRLHRSISRGRYEVRLHTEHERKRANSAPACAHTVEQRLHMHTEMNNPPYGAKGKGNSALKRTQTITATTVVATPRRNSIEKRITPISPKPTVSVSAQLLSPPPTASAHNNAFARAHSSPQCTALQNQPMRSRAVAARGRGRPIQDSIINENNTVATGTNRLTDKGSSSIRINRPLGSTSARVIGGGEPTLKLVGGYTTGGTPFRVVERSAALGMRYTSCRASTSTTDPIFYRSESQDITEEPLERWGRRSQRASASPLPSAVQISRSLGRAQHASAPRSTSVASVTGDRSVLSLLERDYQSSGNAEEYSNTRAMGVLVRAGDEEALEEVPRLRVVGMVPVELPKSPLSLKPQTTKERQGRYAASSAGTPPPPSSTRETTASHRERYRTAEDQTRRKGPLNTCTPIRTVFVFPISTLNAPRSSSRRQSQSQPPLNGSSCRATPTRVASPLLSRNSLERHRSPSARCSLAPSTGRERVTVSPSPSPATHKEGRRSSSASARCGKQPAVTVAFGRTVSARDTKALRIMGVNGP